jgi:hypothetical protein
MLKRIGETLDKHFDRFENKMELKKWNKLIKRACKQHFIKNKLFIDMYTGIQKDVLNLVNEKGQEGVFSKEESFKHTPFSTIIKQRIYDLNREFIFLVNGEFHNSLYALTRQIVEIYIRLIQCRYDNTLLDRIVKEERQKLTIKDTIISLKKKAKFPYLKDTDESKFLESTLSWFNYFSNLYHLSGISLSQNMWVSPKDEFVTKLYIEKPKLNEGDKLLIFSKKSVVTDEQYKILIHQFYTFSGLSIREIKLLEEQDGI